jgi:DNA-binding transcriptional regulator YhcF (GntR family)
MATPPPIIITAELDDAKLSFAAFRVICHLIRRGAAQKGAWGSTEGMATSIGCSKNTVKTALRELLDSGWITRTGRPGITSLYQLHTQTKNEPSPKTDPAQNLGHGVDQNLGHGVDQNLGHEGVKGRSQEKELPPKPPEGVSSPADLTPDSTANDIASQIDATPVKKENGPAQTDTPIHTVPTAIEALRPLLLALHRDPDHALTPQEEHDLLPILRSPAGLKPADITAIAHAVTQRATYPNFDDIPKDSPLRSVRRKLSTLLADWPQQAALAHQITGKKKSTAQALTKPAWLDYPWEAVHWHLNHEEPPPLENLYRRDHIRYRKTWDTWTEAQRHTAIHRYQNRITTPIETTLTEAA